MAHTLVDVLFGLVALLTACFGVVLLAGAPFLPTLKPQIGAALDLLNLKAGQTMLELGCGDGRVLAAAAERGWQVVGYELNPLLALVSWLRTRRYGRQVRVIWGDYWGATWPQAEGIFAFLLPRYMSKLDKKVMQYPYKTTEVASFAFKIPGKKPAAIRQGVYLYRYSR